MNHNIIKEFLVAGGVVGSQTALTFAAANGNLNVVIYIFTEYRNVIDINAKNIVSTCNVMCYW